MRRDFDPDDYAVVVKLRAVPPNPWKWEIYGAGKRLPIEQSSTFFNSRGAAQAAGKKALMEFLARQQGVTRPADPPHYPAIKSGK